MSKVDFQHADYTNKLPEWELVSDVCAGERAVKTKGDIYLPRPNPTDLSAENKERFVQYVKRACFFNATGRTKKGLTGLVFSKNPTLDVPATLEYVQDDVDGAGVSIYQQSQRVVGEVLEKGRHALFVDYPKTKAPTSLADQMKGNIRATIISVDARRVINWRTERIGSKHLLSLVVINEEAEEQNDFEVECIPQYRVLRLQMGIYTVETWRKNTKGEWIIYEEAYAPLNGAGQPWSVIPFQFIGSENNDTSVDDAPLCDMANVNIAHYRNSADYEDSAYFIGQAQPWLSGLDENWRDHLEKTGIYFGSRAPLLLPVGGSAGLLQAGANTLVKEAMDQKEKQMVALGARLVDNTNPIKTATQADDDAEAAHSPLSMIASNVSEAYTTALQWVAEYMNVTGEISYELNQDFMSHTLDSNTLLALIQLFQTGKYPEGDFWDQLRKAGLIDSEKDDETIKDEVGNQSTGLNLDAGVGDGSSSATY